MDLSITAISKPLSLITALISFTWAYSLLFILQNPALYKLSEIASEDQYRNIVDSMQSSINSWYAILLPITIIIAVIVFMIDLYEMLKNHNTPSLGESLVWRNIALISPYLLYSGVLLVATVSDQISDINLASYDFSDLAKIIPLYTLRVLIILLLPLMGSAYYLIFQGVKRVYRRK